VKKKERERIRLENERRAKLEMDKKIYEETKLMKYSEEEEEKIEMEKQKETMKKLAQAKAEQIAAEEERRIKDKYTAAHIKLMELERRIAERNAKLQPSLENTDEPKKLRLQIKKKNRISARYK